jgi:hypothetical protein
MADVIPSQKVLSGGPTLEQQNRAKLTNQYWYVLNIGLLRLVDGHKKFCDRANAFKHALQSFGPISPSLPDFRENKGKAKGHIFHGHVTHDTGAIYIIEWTVVDESRKLIALTGFDTHENFRFRQEKLSKEECERIITAPYNQEVIRHTDIKIAELKRKYEKSNPGFFTSHITTKKPSQDSSPLAAGLATV